MSHKLSNNLINQIQSCAKQSIVFQFTCQQIKEILRTDLENYLKSLEIYYERRNKNIIINKELCCKCHFTNSDYVWNLTNITGKGELFEGPHYHMFDKIKKIYQDQIRYASHREQIIKLFYEQPINTLEKILQLNSIKYVITNGYNHSNDYIGTYNRHIFFSQFNKDMELMFNDRREFLFLINIMHNYHRHTLGNKYYDLFHISDKIKFLDAMLLQNFHNIFFFKIVLLFEINDLVPDINMVIFGIMHRLQFGK